MNLRSLILAVLLMVSAGGFLACHNDQKIIDQHEQALLDEDE